MRARRGAAAATNGRVLGALIWTAIVAMGAVAGLPWVRALRGRALAVLRALMPWATLPAVPVTVLAARSGRRGAALAAATVAAGGVAVTVPLTVRRSQSPAPAGTQPLTIGHVNLLFDNGRVGDIASVLDRIGADVLTFSEYTPHHARTLLASELAAAYPHRLESPAPLASGTALWSRHPVTAEPSPSTRHHTVVGDVHPPGASVRVIVVHAQSPIVQHEQWSADLAAYAGIEAAGPAVMLGDFNAGWWHPEFRAVLARGWRDVHHVFGRGLSPSWPVDRSVVPPFTRLDHALVNERIYVDDVTDLDIPGSDHRGVVVSVRPTG